MISAFRSQMYYFDHRVPNLHAGKPKGWATGGKDKYLISDQLEYLQIIFSEGGTPAERAPSKRQAAIIANKRIKELPTTVHKRHYNHWRFQVAQRKRSLRHDWNIQISSDYPPLRLAKIVDDKGHHHARFCAPLSTSLLHHLAHREFGRYPQTDILIILARIKNEAIYGGFYAEFGSNSH